MGIFTQKTALITALLTATAFAQGCMFYPMMGSSGGLSTYSSSTKIVASPPTSTTTLRPGPGFDGPTAQPPQVGDGPFSNEATMARWEVVPYQTFAQDFNVGVLAFHINGIDRVEFSVNGGKWVPVKLASYNSQSGVIEYWATLHPQDFNDGPLEVRAVAFPKAGVPRVLDPMILNSNASGSLASLARYVSPSGNDSANDGSVAKPFASVIHALMDIQNTQGSVDGAIIYLQAGTHVIAAGQWSEAPSSTNRWVTITRAPGLAKSDVTIAGSAANSAGNNDGLQTKLVKVTGVTMTGIITGSAKIPDLAWFDDVDMIGPGRDAGPSFRENQFDARYVTNTKMSNMQDAVDGLTFARNVQVQHIAQSGFHNSSLVVNCSVSDINRGSNLDLHPDAYQFTAPIENSIAYNLVAVDEINATGVRMQPSASNIAIVNSKFSSNAPYVWELERPYQNLYIKDTSLVGAAIAYDGIFAPIDLVFENVTFAFQPPPYSGVTFR